jgi:hypothetical protein
MNIITTIEKSFSFKGLAILTTLTIAIIDYLIPPGAAIGALYLIPMAMLINQEKRTVYLFSFVLTFLIILDFFYFLNKNTPLSIYGNRLISIVVLWVVTSLVITHKIMRDKTEKMKDRHLKVAEEMLFKTNHKVRHSITQILGTACYLIEQPEDSQEQKIEFLNHIKKSAYELDGFTSELTEFITKQKTEE